MSGGGRTFAQITSLKFQMTSSERAPGGPSRRGQRTRHGKLGFNPTLDKPVGRGSPVHNLPGEAKLQYLDVSTIKRKLAGSRAGRRDQRRRSRRAHEAPGKARGYRPMDVRMMMMNGHIRELKESRIKCRRRQMPALMNHSVGYGMPLGLNAFLPLSGLNTRSITVGTSALNCGLKSVSTVAGCQPRARCNESILLRAMFL